MSANSLLDTHGVDLNDLFANGKSYQVPLYQRDYSWQQEQWEDLWADVLELRADGEAYHYMGAIVLQQGDKSFTIIDGQQRLATLSILVLAVLKRIKDLAADEDNEERLGLLLRQFIGTKDPASLHYRSKLTLNENDDSFYQALVNFREPASEQKLPPSQRLLWRAYRFFCERVAGLEISQDGRSLADFLNVTVGTRLVFNRIAVRDELSAYTVFETLNARGLELTQADLVKNYLFAKAKGVDLKLVQSQWSRVVNAVGAGATPAFLRHHINSRQAYIRQQHVYRTVRREVTRVEDVFAFLDAVERSANTYAALADAYDEFWNDYPDCREHVRVLNMMRAEQYKPLLLASVGRFSAREIEKVLGMCVVVTLRFNVIGRRSTHLLEEVYNEAAVAVHRGTVKRANQLKPILRKIYVADDEFLPDFTSAVLQTSSKKKLVRYLLCALENESGGQALDFESAPVTIEHILPENPGDGWGEFDASDRERFTYRLGNLALLERGLNKAAGAKGFREKQRIYQKSQYQWTRQMEYDDWSPAAATDRQRKMAEAAARIWRF